MRVLEHYKYNKSKPVNFWLPEKASYQNPLTGVKCRVGYGW